MIKRHRLKKGLSRKEVAERLNIPLREYDLYEKRRESLNMKHAYMLSTLLVIPLSLLE